MEVLPMTRKRLPEVKVHKDWHKSSKGRWSLTLGWRGSRVRVTQRESGGVFYGITWISGRGQDWKSFKTTRRSEAQDRAEAFIRAQFDDDAPSQARPLTLGELWTKYQQEAPGFQQNTKRTQSDKRAAAGRLLAFFGAKKRVEYLTPNDVERYAATRRTGQGWPDGRNTRPVRATSIRDDLGLLRTMILWATRERTTNGVWLLSENPLRGVKLPREENPRRPVTTYDRFLKTRAAMQELSKTAPQERGQTRWVRMELALVLAEATGARIGAIRGLRWPDINFDTRAIRWQAQFDKRGRERVVPMPEPLAEQLRGFKVRLGVVGDDWLFPAVRKDEPWPRDIFGELLRRAEAHAGLPPLGSLWHAYRRKWATERKNLPLVDVKAAGGWRDTQTLTTSYQQADEQTMLVVMESPVKLRDRQTA
jgi:integrase